MKALYDSLRAGFMLCTVWKDARGEAGRFQVHTFSSIIFPRSVSLLPSPFLSLASFRLQGC